VRLIGEMPLEVTRLFRDELTRLVESPTASEKLNELDEAAGDALRKLGFGERD
jgi:hypothetical protein